VAPFYTLWENNILVRDVIGKDSDQNIFTSITPSLCFSTLFDVIQYWG